MDEKKTNAVQEYVSWKAQKYICTCEAETSLNVLKKKMHKLKSPHKSQCYIYTNRFDLNIFFSLNSLVEW